MRFLAVSAPNDEHALLPLFLLREAGHETEFWSPSDAPIHEQTCVHIGEGGIEALSRGSAADRELSGFDVVLFRKHTQPTIGADIHPSDLPVVKREFGNFMDNCFRLISPSALWVNPWLSLFTCGKLEQLAAARQLGWATPETLVSYNPDAIRAFHGRHRSNGVIVKSFTPAVWQDDLGKTFVSFTSELTEDVLADTLSLSSVPAIYQERIEKRHELRVTMFGSFGLCVRIDSQVSDLTKLDWRIGGPGIALSRIDMDEGMRLMCVEMMKRLGIAFGCFDFIVAADGTPVFLEVNSAGQFLWIEDIDPDIPMLSLFCEFLAAGRFDFEPGAKRRFPSLEPVGRSSDFTAFSDHFAAAHPPIKNSLISREAL